MRMLLLVALLGFVSLQLAAVDIPSGSNAMVEGVPSLHLLKFSNGRRVYFANLETLKGFEPKANGAGCILYVDGDKGVQAIDVATGPDQVLAAIHLARQ